MRRTHGFDVSASLLTRSLALVVSVSVSACSGAVTGPGAGDGETDSAGGMGYERPNSGGEGGSGSSGSAACASSAVTVAGGKWRRLTQRQYRNTAKDLLGIDANVSDFLDDSTTGSFATNTLPPQANDISAYAEAADALAAQAVSDPAKLTSCNIATTGNDACAAKFIKEFGARAYRRELTPTEVTLLTNTYNLGKADGFAQGLRLVLQSILQSPNFLYLAEFGVSPMKGVAKLTSGEIASRLSYILWNTTPDAQLMAAVKAGELDTAAGLQKHAKRMMSDAPFSDALGEFLQNQALQRVLYREDGPLMTFFTAFLGGPVRHFDFTWLRCVAPGAGTPPHADVVYMGRGTKRLFTAWTHLSDIRLPMGGLMVLEGSHRNKRLRQGYGQRLQRGIGGRWLCSEFELGDVLIFNMHLVHASLDNGSTQFSLSSDSRYQLASEPVDERWVGAEPPGHGPVAKRGRIC